VCIPKLDLIIQIPFSSFFYKEFHLCTSNIVDQQFFSKNSQVVLQSVLVFSQAHILKAVGSKPTPATNNINDLAAFGAAFFVITAKLPQIVTGNYRKKT